jgi:ATP-dependent DNA helicase RecG
LPDPFWKSDPKLGVTVTFRAPEVTPEVSRLIQHLKGEMLRRDLQSAMGLKDDEHFRKAYLLPALESGFIEMTIPDKPTSNKQCYRLTPFGKSIHSKHHP